MNKRRSRQEGSSLAFLDMLFNMVLAFAFLFVLAFLLIRPPAPPVPANVQLKAEFMLTLTWPDKSFDDVDLWLQLPNGKKVWYSQRDTEYATLDRDDRGGHGDTFGQYPNRQVLFLNREVITVRAIVPGRYIAAVHVYSTFSDVEGIPAEVSLPYTASIEVLKINPRVERIAKVDAVFKHRWEAKTLLAFTVNQDGVVTDIELNPPDVIVEPAFGVTE